MLELLLIAQIATDNHYCYMETAQGQTVNLNALCGVSNSPNRESSQGGSPMS